MSVVVPSGANGTVPDNVRKSLRKNVDGRKTVSDASASSTRGRSPRRLPTGRPLRGIARGTGSGRKRKMTATIG
jgi:hypothetical protein